MDKLNLQPNTLGSITKKIFQGIATSADKIYVLQMIKEENGIFTCYSTYLDKQVEIESGLLKPFLMGKDIHRYEALSPENVVVFPYIISGDSFSIMSQPYLKMNYPKGWNYLLENREVLSERERGKYKGQFFYAFSRPQSMVDYENTKIVLPDIAYGPQMSLDSEGIYYHTTTVYSVSFLENYRDLQKYFLGILNSKLFWFFIKNTGNVLRGGYFRFKTKYLEPYPIRVINSEVSQDRKYRDRVENLVGTMLDLNKRMPNANTPNEKNQLQRQIDATDAEIDRLVYELYGLTDDEIRIVEESVG